MTAESVTLRDLGSRNGLYFKYRRLAEREIVPLASGDTFLIGSTNLVLLHERTGRPQRLRRRIETVETAPAGVTSLSVPYERFLGEADRASTQADLQTLAAAIERGLHADEPTILSATRHALQLAVREGDPSWIDELLRLYEAGPLVLPIETLTAMHDLLAERAWRSQRLGGYVALVRPVLDDAGPRGRALLTQLEMLLREHG